MNDKEIDRIQQTHSLLGGNAQTNAPLGDGNGEKVKTSDKERLGRRWLEILIEYTQSTTFHGIAHVTSPQPFLIRRFVWLVLFLGGCVLFGIQVVTSVMYFTSWPVAVDVKINYNDTIVFPAVTICNQNAFRTTEAYKRQHYYLINELFSGNEVHGLNNTGISLEDLYQSNGHQLDDLVVSCTWDGRDCNYTNFMPTLTDFGLCYTFNSGRNEEPLFQATQTGSEGGLRLQLNIEQYEYMPGPNPGAGLKLQIHNQDDIPLVKDHGLAVPPGSHGFVAIRTVEVNNLKHPHGKCNDSVELDYFKTYTISSCYMNCKEHFLVQRCGCRDVYMPEDRFQTAAVCTVDSYQNCMPGALDDFLRVKDMCECPIPCHRRMYDPTMSYASTSNFDIDALLRHQSTKELQNKYVEARETQQRVNEGVRSDDTRLIHALNMTVINLTTAFSSLSASLNAASESLDALYRDIDRRMSFHLERGLEAVKFTAEHDFIRGWDMYEERAFDFVTSDFFDVPTSVKRVLGNYSVDLENKLESRKLLYSTVRNMLEGRKELVFRAEEYLNKTHHAYNTGEPILTYTLTLDRRYDMSYISLDVVTAGIDDEIENYQKVQEGMTWFKEGIALLEQVGEVFVQTGQFNDSLYIEGQDRFYKACRRINYRLFMYEDRVVEKPLEVIEERIADFERINRTLHSAYAAVLHKLSKCHTLLVKTTQNLLNHVLALSHEASEYLTDVSKQKSPLCKAAVQMDNTVRLLTVAFADLRSQVRSLDESLYDLKEAFVSMWTIMLGEVSTKTAYEHIYNDTVVFLQDENQYDFFITVFAHLLRTTETVLRDFTKSDIVKMVNGDFHITKLEDKTNELLRLFRSIAQDIDLTLMVGDKDEKLLFAVDSLRTSLQIFLEGNEIDSTFYRENFMRLDVFMQELSYEEITQQKAYDVARLLSDIGGSMGLFIGGSVLTIFEFFDLFIHHGARMALNQ